MCDGIDNDCDGVTDTDTNTDDIIVNIRAICSLTDGYSIEVS